MRHAPFDKHGIASAIYRRVDTGEEVNPNGEPLPAGAVWANNVAVERVKSSRAGPDGRVLYCMTPGEHTWCIDGRASNCTMPSDDVHRCWVRHGKPEDGTLHVDKNGHTCSAGAGSIQVPGWHGYLHNGVLSENG